jgi:hypothetical protein
MHRFTTRPLLAVATFLSLTAPAAPVHAQKQILQDRPVTMETLLDRINIQDFLTRYYYDLSVGKAHELAEYFTADAVLDVDGVVAKGHKEIAKLYERPAVCRSGAVTEMLMIPVLTRSTSGPGSVTPG